MVVVINEEYLKDKTQEFDVETIFTLSLNGLGLFDVGCLGNCINLQSLNLSNNKLSSVLALKSLTQLEYLDLSSNRLSALTGLECLESLISIDVAGNFLNSIDCFLPLTKIQSLKLLRTKDRQSNLTNPVYSDVNNNNNELDEAIVEMLTNLSIFNVYSDVNNNNNELDEAIVEMLTNLSIFNDEPLRGEGEEFHQAYHEVNNHKQSSFKKVTTTWKPFVYNQEIPYIRVGFEKNEVFEKAKAHYLECENESQKAHSILQKMKEDMQ